MSIGTSKGPALPLEHLSATRRSRSSGLTPNRIVHLGNCASPTGHLSAAQTVKRQHSIVDPGQDETVGRVKDVASMDGS